MATELLTVIALPYSRAGNADFHVSLFIAPSLTPDQPDGVLADFVHFRHWARVLREHATVELRDQRGPLKARPLLDPLSPDLWDALFPPDTPVRSPRALDWTNRKWRTFRAAAVQDAGKLMHAVAMFADPTSPPLPSDHPWMRLMEKWGTATTARRGYDESFFTEGLDAAVGETGDPREPGPSLRNLEAAIAAEDPLRQMVLELHRARRFYERPESAMPYRERPLEGARSRPAKRPEPDFHERCSLVGDHPTLQRQLGLVLDLRLQDPSQLGGSQWLSARIVPNRDDTACRETRTRCEAVDGDVVTVAGTEDWSRGRLCLGDEDRFGLLDLEPDGTALKLDRYLWTLPRLLASQANGDPVSAAPAALRTVGFTVVRHGRATNTQDRMACQTGLKVSLDAGGSPTLLTEDVTQGMRVEVWDDAAKAWFSLHARRIDASVAGRGPVLSDWPEEGFIQGTTATETPDVENSPVHIHEAVFGWQGWSLSAPRPGRRVRHENGRERVEDAQDPADPITPLLVRSKVEPGTLPRLRYGRFYAFRAWGVDLAGNSRSHGVGPVTPPSYDTVRAVSTRLAGGRIPALSSRELEAALRAETATLIRERPKPPGPPPAARPLTLETLQGEEEVEAAVIGRLRERRARTRATASSAPAVSAGRASVVTRVFSEAATGGNQPLIVDTAKLDPSFLAQALPEGSDAGAYLEVARTVTPLRPFLRWDPVQPPAVVARHPYSAGESLRQLVVRSGVAQDPETLAIHVTAPADYATERSDLGYRSTSERHLAPPKTSQSEAELHGAFDDAIGSTDVAEHKRVLAVVLRESGTLFDVDVPRLDDPTQRDRQVGIDLVLQTGIPPEELKTLPLQPGDMPATGQYVVHDTDQLVLPYLPDPLGRGISLVFPDAGRDRQIPFPFGTEGFTARYAGRWPALEPIRLVLTGAEQLEGGLEGNELRVGLPPGDVQRFRLSSSLVQSDLSLFGPWRILPEGIRDNADVREAAADGWLWALTPFDDVTLVHAVPRPLEAPRPTLLKPIRPGEGATDVVLLGGVDVHGPSTESITAEASWTDPVDDLSLPVPDERVQRAVAFTTRIRPEEDIAVLHSLPDQQLDLGGDGPVWAHQARHGLNDTLHHTIEYRMRATTRFREYFDAAALVPGGAALGADRPGDDGQSVVGPAVTLSVPSSARPEAPVVHSVLPLFRWDEGTEPEQPVAMRRRRRAGVRIYLERPWYSSGDGELLGVLLSTRQGVSSPEEPVSQWGGDPIWQSAPVAAREMAWEFEHKTRVLGIDDRPLAAHPVTGPVRLPLTALPARPEVYVLGYKPRYSSDRGMWYVDVALDPGSTFWPFVRLTVARYQPDSIAGCHLSAPVRCDFVQLTPERTTSVSRTDVRHVRVVVSGPVGTREQAPVGPPRGVEVPRAQETDWAAKVAANRLVVARLQRRDPAIPTDLGWMTVDAAELAIRGYGRNDAEAAWVGELEAPEDLPLRRPGENPDWRVTVEEWERLPGDPASLVRFLFIGLPPPAPVWEERLIFADEIPL